MSNLEIELERDFPRPRRDGREIDTMPIQARADWCARGWRATTTGAR
jgi:hypothetical protein